MREAAFVRQNKEKWIAFEKALDANSKINPDHLSDLYIHLTNDLAFAQTYYQNSNTLRYLNSLATQAHQKIYINKKENGNSILRFFAMDFPLFFSNYQREFLFAILVFFVAVGIGTVSTLYDDSFVRLILGDDYVNWTLDKIEEGNPTAVYQTSGQGGMFLDITLNNIRVGMFCFAMGILTSLGSLWVITSNGIMVGAFFTMFYKEGVTLDAWRVIMLHGTIELSIIVVCGAAGIILGNSLLFPGTYERKYSFVRGVKAGLKVMVSTIPLFIIAGFIEGFVTRYAFMPAVLNWLIVIASAALIIWYYGIYPQLVKRKYEALHRAEAT
ncbi:stage II sporulation protein M [Nonlabens xiamenensis]|uniref:stage II sporulation protein M n=1 Tax=Nonlabens xiamenensis TaxID=2341043 RepID=UPI000F60E846|nr:stage II sporulation protein M [Nonlabens xiamenensis]